MSCKAAAHVAVVAKLLESLSNCFVFIVCFSTEYQVKVQDQITKTDPTIDGAVIFISPIVQVKLFHSHYLQLTHFIGARNFIPMLSHY